MRRGFIVAVDGAQLVNVCLCRQPRGAKNEQAVLFGLELAEQPVRSRLAASIRRNLTNLSLRGRRWSWSWTGAGGGALELD